MINSNNLTVSAKFDTGDFLGAFSIHCKSDKYNNSDICIQKRYNLKQNEFKLLEFIILTNIEEALKSLRPNEFKKEN